VKKSIIYQITEHLISSKHKSYYNLSRIRRRIYASFKLTSPASNSMARAAVNMDITYRIETEQKLGFANQPLRYLFFYNLGR
jgi:hypothetical protein